MTTPFTRRRFLAGSGALAAAAAGGFLTSCGDDSGSPESGSSKGSSGKIRWWDQFLPKAELEKSFFAKFHDDGGPEVEYTVYNPAEQGEALQLAKQSNELPDVFTLAGLKTPPAVLQQGGWFQPLTNADEIKANFPEGTFIDGIHIFDGDLYSFPLGTSRGYVTLPWGNKEMLDQAEIEVTDGPQSFDDFREKVRTAQEKVGKPGLVLNLNFPERMANFVVDLAQNAGFDGGTHGPGQEAVDYATGAFSFHHDAVLEALDFLLSFQKDKLLLPASSQLDARQARTQWAGGAAVWFIDGPFAAGVVKTDLPDFMKNLAVTQMPTADGSEPIVTNQPKGGDLWISAESQYAEDASELLLAFTGDEFRTGQAEAMDGGPFDLTVVPDSDAHDTFKQCCAWYEQFGKLAPSPIAKNPEVALVIAKMKPVDPDFGAIIQGAFSGDVSDVPAALKKLSDDMELSREAAIKESGLDVSPDDWAFPDWVRGEDYTSS